MTMLCMLDETSRVVTVRVGDAVQVDDVVQLHVPILLLSEIVVPGAQP